MPTKDRPAFIRAAIRCFLEQTYEPRELIVLDDGDEFIGNLLPRDPRIRYVALPARQTTGMKRNLCCEASRGEIICHFDDDDWSAPERIADQVARLEATGLPATGYNTLLFWDVTTGQAKRYSSDIPGYVVGTSLCYLREFWQRNHFEDVRECEDNRVVYSSLREIAAVADSRFMVARIHNSQTSPKAGIQDIVDRSVIPTAFWANEEYRLTYAA